MLTLAEQDVRQQLLERRDRLAGLAAVEDVAEVQDLLQVVDTALERLAGGSFGVCTVCHDPVELDRLAADPLVRVCLGCLSPAQSQALERDLETAVEIQTNLLPPRDWRDDGWEIHYRYQPLGPVSGDHIDLVRGERGGDATYFLFGDVSGKGVAASLLMSNLQALFRSLIHVGLPLCEVLDRVNRLFSESTPANAYATLVAGRAGADGTVEIANAGHLSPLVVRSGSVSKVCSSGLPIGMFADGTVRMRQLALEPDDYLLLYTDGLSEATNPAGEEYGPTRLSLGLEALRGRSAEATVEASLAGLDRFLGPARPSDDLTVMAIRRVAV